MKKIIITNGLIAGAIVSLFMAVSAYIYQDNFDSDAGMVIGFSGMLVAFSFVFVGVKKYRDNQNGGVITFGKALKIGALIALIASTIYVGVWLLEHYCFYPDFMEKYTDAVLKKMDRASMTAAEIKAKTDEMNMYKEMYKNPAWVVLFTYMEVLPIAIPVPLISAFILKKK